MRKSVVNERRAGRRTDRCATLFWHHRGAKCSENGICGLGRQQKKDRDRRRRTIQPHCPLKDEEAVEPRLRSTRIRARPQRTRRDQQHRRTQFPMKEDTRTRIRCERNRRIPRRKVRRMDGEIEQGVARSALAVLDGVDFGVQRGELGRGGERGGAGGRGEGGEFDGRRGGSVEVVRVAREQTVVCEELAGLARQEKGTHKACCRASLRP